MSVRKEAGQSMVEFAVLLPVFLLILLGCLDLGRAFSIWLTMVNVSREGARYACVLPEKTDIILKQMEDEVLSEGLSLDSLVTPEILTPDGKDPGDPVRVTVGYTLPVLTSYLFGGQPLVIRAATQMPIILGADGGV